MEHFLLRIVVLALFALLSALPVFALVKLIKKRKKREAQTSVSTLNKIRTTSYVVAGMSFIPLIGVLFAIITIITGLEHLKSGGKKLIILGVMGIMFTVGIYGTLFYVGEVVRGGVYDELRSKLAKTFLVSLTQSIEYYKVANGRYPNSLQELQSSPGTKSFNSIYDPTLAHFGTSSNEPTTFYYQLTQDKMHYYLLGLGADRKPFTEDDILPAIPEQERAHTGLIINPASLPIHKKMASPQ